MCVKPHRAARKKKEFYEAHEAGSPQLAKASGKTQEAFRER
jgi:hypothetical protein